MSLSRRQIRAAIVIGVVVGIVAVPVVGSVLSGFVATSGTIPMSTNTGTTVYVSGASDIAGTDWPFDNTVDIVTDKGNVTVTGNGAANMSIAASEITGTWTNATAIDASGAALTIDPEDKAKLTVDGAATEVAFSDYGIDNGNTDLVITGPDGTSSDVTFYNLEAGINVTAVDADQGIPIDVVEVNEFGQATFTIGHSTTSVELQEGDQTNAPTQDNPSPTGNLQFAPSDLQVDVDDADFPNDNVTVTMDLDGSQVHQETLTSAGTVTTAIPQSGLTGGEHTWTVTTTDQYGNERVETYTYAVPDTLYIRNETNTSQLVTDPINVTVQFYGEEQIYERQTSDGTVNLTGLPLNQPLVVDIDASQNYTARTTYFNTGDIYEQQSVYLLNNSLDTIEARFTLNDQTGSYDETSVLYVSRPINESGNVTWRTVHADQFGVEGVTAILQADERYRLRIATADGSVSQDLGPYRSDVTESVEVVPSSPGVTFTNQTQTFGYGAELDNRSLTWSYYDTDNETDSLTIWIHERGDPNNRLTANETYLNLGNASGQLTLTENESKKEWAVKFVVDRNGDQRTYRTLVRNQARLFPEMLDDGYRQMIGVGALLLLAGALSVLNVGVGAVVFGISGGLLWWTGWLGGVTSGVAVAMYLFVAVMVYMYKGGSY